MQRERRGGEEVDVVYVYAGGMWEVGRTTALWAYIGVVRSGGRGRAGFYLVAQGLPPAVTGLPARSAVVIATFCALLSPVGPQHGPHLARVPVCAAYTRMGCPRLPQSVGVGQGVWCKQYRDLHLHLFSNSRAIAGTMPFARCRWVQIDSDQCRTQQGTVCNLANAAARHGNKGGGNNATTEPPPRATPRAGPRCL